MSDDFANPDLTTVSPLEAYKRIMARFDAELSWRSRSDYSPRALWYWHGRKAFKQAWIHSAQEISPVCAELGVVMVACGVQEKARAAETSTPVAPTRRGWSAARRWRHEQTKVGV